ncbi:MAG TPA: thiamine phosphate synthase [Candidatus Dormibacteraeota bacterium]
MAVVASAREGLHAAHRATVLQLRSPRMTARELEVNAIELVGASPVPVLISSRCDIALASGAAGVNLPEHDISVQDARRLLGQRLVGRSVHSVQGAVDAEREGADFVIFGPVWSSESHAGAEPRGLGDLAAVTHAVQIPVLAIGGVTDDRIAECEAAGAAGYAAIRLFQ